MNQELNAAQQIDALMPPIPPPPGAPEPSAPRKKSNLENTARQATIFVTVMVVACGAGVLWMSRGEIRDGARSARKRTSNPIDLVLWMGGSEKSLDDVFQELGNEERYGFEELKAESEFQDIDFENLPDFSAGSINLPEQ